jgi:hypothetical protein
MTFKSSLLKTSTYGISLFMFVIVQGCGVGFKAEVKDGVGVLSTKELAAEKEKAEKEKAEKEKADKAAKEAKEKEEARKREQAAAAGGTGASGSNGTNNDGEGNNASDGTANSGSEGNGGGNQVGTGNTGSGTATGTGAATGSGTQTSAPPPTATGGEGNGGNEPSANGNTPATTQPTTTGQSGNPPVVLPPKPGQPAIKPPAGNAGSTTVKPPEGPTAGSATTSKCGDKSADPKCIPAADPDSIAIVPGQSGTAPAQLPVMSVTGELKADQTCPESYVQAAKKLAHEGSSGLQNSGIINGIISKLSNGKMDNPRNACEAEQPGISLVQVEPAQAVEALAKIFKMDPKVLTHMDRVCEKALVEANPNPADAKWLRAYGLVSFAKKWTAYEDGIISILMLRQQLGMMNPDPKGSPVECIEFQSARVKAYCAAIGECQSAEQRNVVFTEKARMIIQLITAVQALKGPAQSNEALKKAEVELEKISVIKSPSFKKYREELGNKAPGEKEVRDLLFQNVLGQIAKLDVQLKDANLALNCVLGTSPNDCSKTAKLDAEFLVESPSRFLSAEAKSATGLLELDRFNTCMGQRRDVTIAEDVVVGAGWIGAGLLTHRFSPRLLKSVKLIATKAPRVAAQGGRIGLAALAGGLATNDSLNVSEQCADVSGSISEHQNLIRSRLVNNESPMTCETHAEEILIAEAVESCGIEYAKTFALAGAGMVLPELGVLSKLAKTKLASRIAKLKGGSSSAATTGAGQAAGNTTQAAASGAATQSANSTAAAAAKPPVNTSVNPLATGGSPVATAGTNAATTGASASAKVNPVQAAATQPVSLQNATASANLHNGLAVKPPTPVVAQPVAAAKPTLIQKADLAKAITSAEGKALANAPKVASRADGAELLGLSRSASASEIRQALDAAKSTFNGQGHSLSYKNNKTLKEIISKLAEIEAKL